MFAVYASQAIPDDPLAALAIGDLPEPEVPEGWLRIKISHASLNRHDGSEDEFGPGEVSLLPPGHDAWVVGNEPVVVIDISGMVNYAKPA
jgi:hypothetical protein